MNIEIPCPTCNGDGFSTHEDRHAETRQDVCRTCKGRKVVPANTGQSPEASYRASNSEDAWPQEPMEG